MDCLFFFFAFVSVYVLILGFFATEILGAGGLRISIFCSLGFLFLLV